MARTRRGHEHKFEPPKDVRQWWRSACCGPATSNRNESCGFCGKNVLACCREHTDFLKAATPAQLQGYAESQLGYPPDDAGPKSGQPCGGSGFQCYNCGRMWAQDSCGGQGWGEEESSDGQPLVRENAREYLSAGTIMTDECVAPWADERVSCICGQFLFWTLPDGWEPESPKEDDDVIRRSND